MKLKSQMKFACSVSALVILSCLPAVSAQDAERAFETIVVTTQKQAESIQDVPIAVSAFDESML